MYAQCGQSAPILCKNICTKELNCKNHVCEKLCHVEKCEPCKKNCPQSKFFYFIMLVLFKGLL